jgi:hypothetical protein
MGRPSIYGRAMTTAERQHRHWAKRITSAPPDDGESTLTLGHLHTDPVAALGWYKLRFGVTALRAVRDPADQVLNGRGTYTADDDLPDDDPPDDDE